MTLRAHVLTHVPFEGPANLAGWLHALGARVSSTRLWAGEAPPAPDRFDWLVVMGGPMNADDERIHPWLADEKRSIEQAIGAGKRVLGVCLGAQLIARVLGAEVKRNPFAEIGWFPIERVAGAEASAVGRALPARAEVFHWHGDRFELPAGALPLARSEACEQQAFLYRDRVLALQFHLEITQAGARALVENCGAELVAAPYVQTREALLADAARFTTLEPLLGDVLAAFAGAGDV